MSEMFCRNRRREVRMQKLRDNCKRLIFISVIALLPTQLLASKYCDNCPRDERGRIQRSMAAKTEFRRANPCPATGHTKGRCQGYVIDHIVPLKRGGPDTPANMQWQTVEDARAKDKWE